MKKSIKIIIMSVVAVILALILGASIYTAVQKAKGNSLPMPFGIAVSVTETGSMEPNMPQGSLIVLVKSKSYELDDIVAFLRSDDDTIHTVHRIVEIDGDTVITCGDANDGSRDPAIDKSEIKGKVIICIPKLGFAIKNIDDVVSHPVTIVLILAALVAILFLTGKKPRDEKSVEEIKAEIDKLKNDEDNDEDNK